MARTFTFEIGELSATARTKREAKTQCETAAKDACTGSYNPWMFADKGRMVLLWRSPYSGWTFKCVSCDVRGLSLSPQVILLFTTTRDQARGRAAYAFAQSTYDKWDDIPAELLDAMGAEARQELTDWYAFQDRYAKAKASGCSDEEAHRMAVFR